jgi:hypothetical protein
MRQKGIHRFRISSAKLIVPSALSMVFVPQHFYELLVSRSSAPTSNPQATARSSVGR